jgi:hypothetical protein
MIWSSFDLKTIKLAPPCGSEQILDAVLRNDERPKNYQRPFGGLTKCCTSKHAIFENDHRRMQYQETREDAPRLGA